VEELIVYFRRQKSKTISFASCQTSNSDQHNSTSISNLKSSIFVVNDIDLLIAQPKEVRSCAQHPYLTLFPISIFRPVRRFFLSKLSFCVHFSKFTRNT
jgi:hypothetical protein